MISPSCTPSGNLILSAGLPAGKSTFTSARPELRRGYVLVNPDSVLINLLGGKGNPLPDERPDGPEIFEFAQDLAKNILDEAVMAGYNLVIDMAMPSESTLLALKQRGYRIDFAIMEVPAGVARKREVSRDLLQLGWGRAGELPFLALFDDVFEDFVQHYVA